MRTMIVKVVFSESYGKWGSKRYDYRTDLPLRVGDQVVVDTVHGNALAKVVEINSYTNLVGELKWIIQTVDMEAFKRREEERVNYALMEARKAEIIKQLDTRLVKMSWQNKYEQLATQDREAAELLEQLRQLERATI